MFDLTKFNLDWLKAERKAVDKSEEHHQRDNVELKEKDFPGEADMTSDSCALCMRHKSQCKMCILESCSSSDAAFRKMWKAQLVEDFPAFHDAAVEMVAVLKCKGNLLDAEIAEREKLKLKLSPGNVSFRVKHLWKTYLTHEDFTMVSSKIKRWIERFSTVIPKQSAHEKGERFEGEVYFTNLNKVPAGHHLVYAGEVCLPKMFDTKGNITWAEYDSGEAFNPPFNFRTDHREILMVVPDKSETPSCDACEHEFKAKAEEHYSGETFNKPVYMWHHGKKCFLSDKYEYTGEFRKPGDDAYETASGDAGTIRPETQTPRWILRLVTPKAEEPKPPEWWQDGWWIMSKTGHLYHPNEVRYRSQWYYRPATLPDLAYTVDGTSYWAYEDNVGNVCVHDTDGNYSLRCGTFAKLFKATYSGKVMPEAQWNWLQAQKGN